MVVTYEEKSTLGRGNYIQVKRAVRRPQLGKVVPVVIGRIEETRNGQFAYFEPETNELNPTFVEDDLSELKRRIEALYN